MVKQILQCIGNRLVSLFCCQSKCTQNNTFLCFNTRCVCYQKHKYCSKFHVEGVLDEIKNKINKISQFHQKIRQSFSQIIQNIQIYFVMITEEINNNIKSINLAGIQKNFYKYFYENENKDKNNKLFSFTSQQLDRLKYEIQQNKFDRYHQCFDKYLVNVEQLKKKVSKQFDNKFRELKQLTKRIIKNQNNKQQQQQKQIRMQNQKQKYKKGKNNLQQQQNQKSSQKLKTFDKSFQLKVEEKSQLSLIQKQKLIQKSKSQKNHQFGQNSFSSNLQQGEVILNQKHLRQQYQHQNENQQQNYEQSQQQNYQSNKIKINILPQQQQPIIIAQQKKQAPSNIIKTVGEYQSIFGYFNKKVTTMHKVFTASQHNFSISSYYQLCGHLTHTLFLLKTQKNKILGAYTPLSFNPTSQSSNRHMADYTKTSFIFSLNQNQIFCLNTINNAIFHDSTKKFVKFGGGELKIVDQGDKKKQNSMCLKNCVYTNKRFHDYKGSYEKLTGSETTKFKLKQWEVFQVKFIEKNQEMQANELKI